MGDGRGGYFGEWMFGRGVMYYLYEERLFIWRHLAYLVRIGIEQASTYASHNWR